MSATPGNATVFPRPWRSPRSGDPLIQEARDRQRRRRRWTMAVVLVATGMAFAINHWTRNGQAGLACASPDGCTQEIAYATKVPNPCTLFTAAQATGVIGDKLTYRQPENGGGAHGCLWKFAPLGAFTSAAPTLMVTVGTATRAEVEKSEQKYGYPLVPGVGQFAYWTGPNVAVKLLTVWDHGYVLTLYASVVQSPLTVEKALALAALKRLP